MVAATLAVKLSAETAQFHQRMTAASTVFGKLTGASTSAHRGLFLVRSGVEQLAGAATGLGGPLGSVARGLLTIGAGGGVALVAAAAIGALTLAYKSLFGGLDKLVEKNEQLAKSLAGGRSVADQLRAGITELGTTVQQTAVKTGAFLSALHGLGDLPLIQDLAALKIANAAEAAATALEQAALGVRKQRLDQMDKSIRQRNQENQQLAATVELTAQLHVAEQGGVATRTRQLALRQAIAEVTARYAAAQVGATAAQTADMVATARAHEVLEQNIKDRERQIAKLRDLAAEQRLMARAAAAGEFGAAGQLTNAAKRNVTLRQGVIRPAEVDVDFSIAARKGLDELRAIAEETEGVIAGINNSLTTGLVDVMQALGDRLGAIFAGLAQGFRGFGNTLFSIIGQVVSNIGRQLIPLGAITAALGKVGLAIKTFLHNPIAAIAAGVALMALGAALSGAAQRSISTMSETGGGGGGFGGGGFASSAPAPASTSGTLVVEVEGGFLDMTNPRIADAFNNAMNIVIERRMGHVIFKPV